MSILELASARRRLLLQSAGALGAGLVARQAFGATATTAWQSSFDKFDGPFSASSTGTLQCDALPVTGRWPKGLRGTFYRNGPARTGFGAQHYEHWFDGDGMIQAFWLGDTHVSHRGVLLRTPKLLDEEKAGRFLYPTFRTLIADAAPVLRPDSINVANINVLPMQDGTKLYALWEGGSALEVDPHTLAAKTFKAWSPDTAGAAFSAHPRVSSDGTVWNFGYSSGSGKLLLYEIAADGTLRREAVIAAPQADMVHDFAITERFLVFLLMPMSFAAAGATPEAFADRFRWHTDESLICMVVDKTDFSTRRFDLPNDGVFHLGNAWEDGNTLHLGYASQHHFLHLIQDPERADANGDVGVPTSSWKSVVVKLDSGQAEITSEVLAHCEFPRFDTRHTGVATKMTLLMRRSAQMDERIEGFDTVVVVRAGQIAQHRYDAGWIAEEHVFVPAASDSREGAGWILGTAYDWRAEKTSLFVFDANNVRAGPLASAALPYGLPLGLHGQFVTS